MKFTTFITVPASASAAIALSVRAPAGGSISVTPHQQYSSSVGVLGCKINTNRVACKQYWPHESATSTSPYLINSVMELRSQVTLLLEYV